jgi:hypothetical protein
MLQEKVDADIKFNAYEALVSGPSSIMKGETGQIKVAIGTLQVMFGAENYWSTKS